MSQVSFDFTEKCFVVTGASSGMGKQTVLELAESGARILAIARRKDRLMDLQALYPENIMIAAVNVCDVEAMDRAVREFVQQYGKLDGGVHAAGTVDITPLKSFNRLNAQRIMDTSFWGGINFLQLCSKAALSNRDASFVLFSSTAAKEGLKGKFAYSAAKASLNVAAQSIAKEIARRGQRINTVMPGWVETDMTNGTAEVTDVESVLNQELLGAGKPQDVTGMVLFLLSNRASWITGAQIPVDGGYLA